MAKKSIYETSFAAGHTGGLYEAELHGVGDVWSDIEASQSMTAVKGERRGAQLDTILSGLELTSQVAGGGLAKEQWKGELGSVEAKLGKGQRVGISGKDWKDTGFVEKLFSGKQYKFGSGEVMDSSQIAVSGRVLQSGGKVNFDRFKPQSMAEEVGGISGSEGGKFYGERKGFDIGDIVGEKSIFAGGKRKLSSVLSSAEEKLSSLKPKRETQVGAGTVLRPDQKLEAKQQKLEEVPSPSKDYSKSQRKIEKIEKKRAKKGDLPWEEEEGFLEWGMKYGG